jgi:EAL domain-containing protein (putative c-di-GMP-specific phosphodiesterase class I)
LLGNETVFVSASIGVTFYPDDAQDVDVLLKNADQAMYQAKNNGRNRLSYFTRSIQESAIKRRRLVSDLRNAITASQFRLFYQPIVDINAHTIHKAEALIRWEHPERGLISPAEFIPLAEETGIIIDIGNWVFHEAAKQVAHWRMTRHPEFQVSINKSPVQFHAETSIHIEWFEYLRKLALPGESIVVEITEGLLLEAKPVVVEQLLAFRDEGIQVSLDDFGTGYSSLAYLKKFDIDYIKIDQLFVRNLQTHSEDIALCEAIILMAHKLGIKVIAEGIETIEQRDLLISIGCDYGQGYLFSRPVPAEQFDRLLDARNQTASV